MPSHENSFGGGDVERRTVATINPVGGGGARYTSSAANVDDIKLAASFSSYASPIADPVATSTRDFEFSSSPRNHSIGEPRRYRVADATDALGNPKKLNAIHNNNNNTMAGEPGVRYLREHGSSLTLGQRLYMKKFGLLIFIFEIIFIVLYAIFVRYGPEADSLRSSVDAKNQKDGNHTTVDLENYYPMFQDIHVMMFVGFGFLMTFLKRYGFSSIGINFLLAAFVIQWAILVEGFFHMEQGYIQITITNLITSDFAAAAVLISMGALLGKLSPEQYIVVGFLEVFFYMLNEYLLFTVWNVTDAGDSMTVHTFGAYFGLTVARILYRKGAVGHAKEGSNYNSDLFAMIGTIFLWVFWPSFNGGLAQGDQRHRAILNTYISLAACCLTAYAVSALLNRENKFDMVHVQNSTLAGGVAVGTSANLMIQPFGALVLGSVAGILSVVGYKYITPFLARKLRVHDTCGVNNLHGMPGVLAALVGAVLCYFASKATYGQNLYEILPALKDGQRTPLGQATYQLAGLGATLGIAIVGGLITGLVLKLPLWIQLDDQSYFDDEDFWEVPPVESVEMEHVQVYMPKKDEHAEAHQLHSYS